MKDASPLLFNLLRFAMAAMVLLAVGWRSLRGVTGGSVRGALLAGTSAGCRVRVADGGPGADVGDPLGVHHRAGGGVCAAAVVCAEAASQGIRAAGWSGLAGAALAFLGPVSDYNTDGGDAGDGGGIGGCGGSADARDVRWHSRGTCCHCHA